MLVLSRKVDETIQIGHETQVRVLRIQGNRVWIGIEAPGRIRVVRGELAGANGNETAATFAVAASGLSG